MLRWLLIVFVVWLLPSSGYARISVPAPVISKADLRAAIYDGDIDRVDASIARTQALFRKGKATSEDVRILFEVFSTTNPKVIAFTERWLDQMPDSAFAHTAQAWVLYRSGWLIRGDRWAAETYPTAMRLHSLNHARALEHAKLAYAKDSTLLPASDAIIRLANTGGDKPGAFQVLDDTMQQYPNWGTLYRALDLANKGYGGSPELAEQICAVYGPAITSPVQDMTRYCRIHATFRGRIDGGRKALKDLVKQEDDASLDYIRAWLAIDRGATPEEAEFARWYFEKYEPADYGLARQFDLYLAFKFGFDFVEPRTIERAKARARVNIEHDPYNPTLLDILAMPSITKERQGNSVVESSFDVSFTAAQSVDNARRKLLVSPYDPDLWRDYSISLRRLAASHSGYGGGMIKGDAATINEIVYSRHDPQRIYHFLTTKLRQMESLEDFSARLKKEQMAQATADIDIEGQIICPTIRAKPLLDMILKEQGNSNGEMQLSQESQSIYQNVEVWALRNNKCASELHSPADTLWFEPVEIDLMAEVQ